MEKHSQRFGFQIDPKDLEFGYPQPVPTLFPNAPAIYSQKKNLDVPLLSNESQSMMNYQKSVNFNNINDLTKDQIEELQKAILEKKEQADNEVSKSEGFFSKVNYIIQWLTCAKSGLLCIYAIYKLYMYNDSTDLISTFCALVMALMMLRKSKVAQQALETKSYKATKGLIKKALIFTGIFVVLYIVWSCRLLNGSNLQAGKNLLTQKELKSRSFNSQEFMQNSNYIRIGFPARNIQKDNDFIGKSNNFNMKNDISLISSEKLTRKALHDRQIEQQYNALFQLPVELPLYILLALITFYFGTKIIVYFISFNNYSIVKISK